VVSPTGDPKTLVFFPSTLTRQESDMLADWIEALFADYGYGASTTLVFRPETRYSRT
jgi:hypothetical protein